MRNRLLYEEFGRRLAAARKTRHLSQADLGALVGLSRTSITNLECGRQAIQLDQLYLLASALRMEVTQLLPKQTGTTADESAQGISPEQRFLQEAKKILLNVKPGRFGADHD